jgi:hypothetical protein
MCEPERDERAARSESGDAEIPPKEWGSFLHSFSQQHEGWLVSIFLFSGLETSVKVNDARLEHVTADELDARGQICISVVRDDGSHLLYQAADPLRLTFKRNPAGAHKGLDITSADGSVTSLRFRVAALPETVDGVLF